MAKYESYRVTGHVDSKDGEVLDLELTVLFEDGDNNEMVINDVTNAMIADIQAVLDSPDFPPTKA